MHAADTTFALAVARRATELGLTYASKDGPRAIAVALPLVPEADDAVTERGHIARTVLAALVKVGTAHRASLLDGLSPLERAVVTSADAPFRLVTARADMLVDTDGVARVLEVNTTIPAMQGYSDIALRAWTEAFIEASASVPPATARSLADEALAAHGSNADDLLDALVAAYALDGGVVARPRIALVHRAGDSQLGELAYLRDAFRARGHDAETVVVDDLLARADGRIASGSFVPDVFYRHVFARLVPEGSAFARALREPALFHVYNPIAAHLEQKTALALLSQAASDDVLAARLSLSDNERATVERHVPWTRVLDGAVVAGVVAAPERYVIKRSWDFGGKSVLLGAENTASWAERVVRATTEGGWVVQERVVLRAEPHLVAVDGLVEERALYCDASAYASFDVRGASGGVVRRASTSPIVNIQSGGGVMPVVTTSLLHEIDRAVRHARRAA